MNNSKIISLLGSLIILFTFSKGRADESLRQIENERLILATSVNYLLDSAQEKEALKLTKDFLAKHPKDPEAYRQLGIIHLFRSDQAEAVRDFEKAYSTHSSSVEQSIDLYLIAKAWNLSGNDANVRDTLHRMEKIEIAQPFVSKAFQKFNENRTLPIMSKKYLEGRYLASLPAANTKIASKSMTESEELTNQKDEISASSSIVFGQDSNPIFIPDGSATKNDAASFFASASLEMGLTSRFLGTWNQSLNIGATHYIKDIAQGFNNFRWSYTAGYRPDSHWFKAQRISLNNSLEQSYQTQFGFNYFYTADTLSMTKGTEPWEGHGIDYQLKLGYRSYANKDLTAKENDRSGYQVGGGLTHKTKVRDWPWMNSLGVSYQKTKGGLFDTMSMDIVTNLQQIVLGDFEILYGLSFGQITYPKNPDKSYDAMTGLGLEVVHSIASVKGMATKFSIARSQNRSDAPDSNFTQDILSIWVTYDLF